MSRIVIAAGKGLENPEDLRKFYGFYG